MNKQIIRQEAISTAYTMLSQEEDYQDIENAILNEDRFQPLLEGKDGDELFKYVNGIIRMAERQAGIR